MARDAVVTLKHHGDDALVFEAKPLAKRVAVVACEALSNVALGIDNVEEVVVLFQLKGSKVQANFAGAHRNDLVEVDHELFIQVVGVRVLRRNLNRDEV